jgi:hypothetical protein
MRNTTDYSSVRFPQELILDEETWHSARTFPASNWQLLRLTSVIDANELALDVPFDQCIRV